jgi:hypothetical protein
MTRRSRRKPAATCAGKHNYATREQAQDAAAAIRRRDGTVLEAYPCDHCRINVTNDERAALSVRAWHLGHGKPLSPRARRLKALQRTPL